jgi:hypothetical protein
VTRTMRMRRTTRRKERRETEQDGTRDIVTQRRKTPCVPTPTCTQAQYATARTLASSTQSRCLSRSTLTSRPMNHFSTNSSYSSRNPMQFISLWLHTVSSTSVSRASLVAYLGSKTFNKASVCESTAEEANIRKQGTPRGAPECRELMK